jgi:hypothetical protein
MNASAAGANSHGKHRSAREMSPFKLAHHRREHAEAAMEIVFGSADDVATRAERTA